MTMSACPEPLQSSTLFADSLEALCAIDEPSSSLVLWERQPLPAITREINALNASTFPDVRTHIHAGQAGTALAELIESQGFDAEATFTEWLADMTRIAEAFLERVSGSPVMARLETLDSVVCPRFHVDNSYLRLVCTYRGPGTEWLEDAQVDRQAQTSGAPNEAIIRCGRPQRMPTFAVGLMKGRRSPGREQAGLVHRSPSPEPAAPARVLFCLEC